MPMNAIPEENTLNTEVAVQVLVRPVGETEWQEFDRGPGYIRVPPDQEVSIRLRNITDQDLLEITPQLSMLRGLVALNLSENRNVTDQGMGYIATLTQLRELNLSSCSLTNPGIEHLKAFMRLSRLDISYCNRLTDPAVKSLHKLPALTYLDVKGCVKLTNGGLSKLRRPGLEIRAK